MKELDVIVIGGGPAGLFAASLCGAEGLKVCLLERNKSAGKKLLISGQGRCNLTNTATISDFITHYGNKERFVRKCLYSFSNEDLMSFFSAGGLGLTARSDGKVFPVSENAGDVLKHLLNMCRKSDAFVVYNSLVSAISSNPDGNDGFILSAGANTYKARSIILAAGGFTFPSTGSDGSAYFLAESLGHSIVKPRPSLTGIIADPSSFKAFTDCAGISLEANLSLFRQNRKLSEYSGRMLFTHKGLSGPLIIDNSRDFSPGDEVRLDFLHATGYEQASDDFLKFCKTNGKSAIRSFFKGKGLPDRLISAVFRASGASTEPTVKAAEIKAVDRKKLLAAFSRYAVKIESLEGKNRAMCTAGGIETSEITPATMESKIVPGLYFAGEIIDVDGDSGGFNLQFAFSSAAAAAESIINRIKSSKITLKQSF